MVRPGLVENMATSEFIAEASRIISDFTQLNDYLNINYVKGFNNLVIIYYHEVVIYRKILSQG